jgi:hypothetical protein
VEEGAEWVARRGVEELAVWYAGGILLKGAGLLGQWAVPTVRRALGHGVEAAAGWLRTTLVRLPGEKKRALERLWAKVQLEGPQALSAGERAELRGLMEGLEQLVRTPLDDATKARLRQTARQYYKELHPELARVMDESPLALPVHHRRPLAHAHLFPDMDINAAENLVLMRQDAHKRINLLWERFRKRRPAATAQEVEAAAREIDARFSPWYHRVEEPPKLPYTLEEAEEAVWREFRRLFPGKD